MTDVPMKDRPYHLFVSYAHEDRNFVVALVTWLTRSAQMKVWHDDSRLSPGSTIGTELPDAVRLATSALFVVSNASSKSGWMKEEYGAALEQRARYPNYRILVVRIDDTDPPGFLRTTKWIDIQGGQFGVDDAFKLLLGLYADSVGLARKDRDVYVSRTWRSNEAQPADAICRMLIDRGHRVVGDAVDQAVFDAEDRIPSIIRSCGAVVAIAPNRSGRTSEFIEQEMLIALELGVPCLAVIDEGVVLSETLNTRIPPHNRLGTNDVLRKDGSQLLYDSLQETFKPALRPHYVFYAASLLKSPTMNDHVRELVDAVAGIECIVGENVSGQHAQSEIIRSIRGALFVISDVSEEGGVNTLIEAGVALGAGTRLHLVAKGEPRPPRFMFRDMEIHFYGDELELLGKIHRIARPYRRRILNRELQEFL